MIKGFQSYRGFNLRGFGYPPNFWHLLVAKLCIGTPNVFEVQKRARGPLAPCQVRWGSDSHTAGGTKNVEFFVFFVCLSVTLLNDKV